MLVALAWEPVSVLPVDWVARQVKLQASAGVTYVDWGIALDLGGATQLHQRLVEEASHLLGKEHPTLSPAIWATGFLVGPVSIIAFPHMFMRLLAARDVSALRRTIYLYPFALALLFIPFALSPSGSRFMGWCFIVAALTDIVDGWLARRGNQVTAFGRIADPFVDKVLTGGAFITYEQRIGADERERRQADFDQKSSLENTGRYMVLGQKADITPDPSAIPLKDYPPLEASKRDALLAALGIVRRSIQARSAAGEVEQGTVFSTTDVTAFEGMAVGLQAALPLAAIVAASLASQSVAAELARGTLRNVLLRPVGRIHVAAGKTLALLGAALATLAMLVATAWVAATWAFDFTAVFEVLPNGQRYPLVTAEEIWPQLGRALLSPLAPLAAYAGIGFLAGAVSRSAAGALGLALGSVVFLDLARTVARPFGFEGWLPSAHLPSPLSDTSFVQFYADIATGVSNASFEYPVAAVIAPVAWAVAAFLLASVVLIRRSVP
ncbi:MAG: CDP-alcohol phosphatidyltransferase family protein [Planctomycetes bacterium]|nr:CDP-alcohol phosphatidyltransferase family protein [Planctomycetota bacterium]